MFNGTFSISVFSVFYIAILVFLHFYLDTACKMHCFLKNQFILSIDLFIFSKQTVYTLFFIQSLYGKLFRSTVRFQFPYHNTAGKRWVPGFPIHLFITSLVAHTPRGWRSAKKIRWLHTPRSGGRNTPRNLKQPNQVYLPPPVRV